jgi:hypothetical protein
VTLITHEQHILNCCLISEILAVLTMDPDSYAHCLTMESEWVHANDNGIETFHVNNLGLFSQPTCKDEYKSNDICIDSVISFTISKIPFHCLTSAMQDFFIGQLVYVPTHENITNHTIDYKGIQFSALLDCEDACLYLGTTCTEKYVNPVIKTYIKLIFCFGLPLKNQHPSHQRFQFGFLLPCGKCPRSIGPSFKMMFWCIIP